MKSVEKYYCELYADEDLTALLRFFSENPTKMLRDRPLQVLQASVDHRQMIVVRAEDSDLIVGTAAVFQFLDMQYVELGCMSLGSAVRGQRLQSVLIAMRILQSYLLAARHVFCVVKKYEAKTEERTRSYKNLLRANFEEWEQPPDELKAARAKLLTSESA